ncbi:MAG: GAF domain-containing protein [Anaerolineae bacterium]
MTEQRVRLLLVDDEESLRVPLKRYLERHFGYQVEPVASGPEALRSMDGAQGRYDVALIDEVLVGGLDGIETMQQIKSRYPGVEVIIFTGWGAGSKQRALRAGAFRYLEKPVDHDELAMLIRTAAQQVRLREIGGAILSERTLDRVLDGIMGAANSLALADEAAIVLLDKGTGKLMIHPALAPMDQRWDRHFTDHCLSKEIIGTGQMLWVPDTTQDGRVNPEVVESSIGSFLGMPIPGESGNLGVLYVYSSKPGRFEDWGTVSVLQTLAGQAGLALANAQAFQRIRSHAGYMESLVEAARGLTRAASLVEQLELAWAFVRKQLQVSTFLVALYDREVETLRFPLVRDEGREIEVPDVSLTGDSVQWGITGHVVKTGQELFWSTSEDKERECESLGIRSIKLGRSCESCLYLPLRVGNKANGAISIQSYERHAFDPIMLDAFRALGSHLTVALENTRLFEAEAQRRREAETLRETALALASTLEPEEIFERILSELQKVVPYDSASVQLLKEDRLEIIAGRGFPDVTRILGFTFPLDGNNPNREVTRRRDWFIVPDAPANYQAFAEEPHRQADIHGWLGVPMMIGGRLMGMIALDKRQPGFYTEEHARLAQTFAAQAAVAVENARLHQETRVGQERLRDFYAASSALLSSKDLEKVLVEIVEQARVAAHARSVSMILIDKNSQIRDLITAGPEQPADETEIIRPEGLSMAVMDSGQPQIVQDAHAERARLNPSAFWRQVAAALCLPVTLEGERVGVMWFHYDEPHQFPRPEVEAMQLYVNQAALAYDSARRIKELEHMRQAAEALAGAADLDEVLERIVNSAREVLQADSAAIWSYDEIRDRFIPGSSVSAGIPVDVWHEFRQEEPRRGRTAYTVMEVGWVGVSDLYDRERYDFLGDATRQLLEEIGVQSFQGIPLTVGDEKLGVLYVNYNYRRSFHEREQEIAQTFANHVALALKKARLLDQLGDARDAAKVVAEVSALEDLPCTLKSIVEGTLRALDCDAVTLFTYDPEREEFGFPPAMAGVRDEATIMRREGMTGLSLVRNIMLLERAHEAEDAQSNALMQGPFVQREQIKSSMGMPLRVGGRPVGVMFVNYRTYHRFTTDELTNIELFANQAAVAIRNAQLYQSKERHTQALRAIQDTSAAVSAVLDLDALLPMITEKAADIFAAPATSLMLWDETETQMVIRAARGLGEEYIQRQRITRQVVDGLIAAGGIVSQVHDISQNPIGIPELIASEGLCSVLATPLTIGGRLLGILNIYSKGEPRRFEEQEKELASVFANHAAIAIENARAYEELKRTKGLVGARTSLAWMGMVSTAWRHAVGNHAANIQLVLELIKRDLASDAPLGHMEERLKSISQAASKIQDTPITAPLQAEEGVVSVSVDVLLKERLQQRWGREPFSSVELECDLKGDETTTVRTSPDWLRRAFDILVDNAVEAMAGCQTKRLSVSTRAVAGGIEVAVKDTGTGIPEDVLLRLFRSAVPKPKGAKGLGVGLLMADTIVQTYGGKIRIGSSGRSGTTMIIWLPIERGEAQ